MQNQPGFSRSLAEGGNAGCAASIAPSNGGKDLPKARAAESQPRKRSSRSQETSAEIPGASSPPLNAPNRRNPPSAFAKGRIFLFPRTSSASRDPRPPRRTCGAHGKRANSGPSAGPGCLPPQPSTEKTRLEAGSASASGRWDFEYALKVPLTGPRGRIY